MDYFISTKTPWMGKIYLLQISKQFKFLHTENRKYITLQTLKNIPFKLVCNEISCLPNKAQIVNVFE